MSALRRILLPSVFAVALCAPESARGVDGPLFLFGGPNRDHFLGCLNCYRSEVFSVWNETGEYGSPTQPDSIWNTRGKYGSTSSDLSPWNPRATRPPLVVDRVGNLYGYFTRNPYHKNRITSTPPYNPGHSDGDRRNFVFLAWLLEEYEWIVTHLDEVRRDY